MKVGYLNGGPIDLGQLCHFCLAKGLKGFNYGEVKRRLCAGGIA